MNSASVAGNSLYPKICEVKYDSRTKFYDCYEQFEYESEEEDELYETSLFDLKNQGLKVEKLKWRIPVNRENSTINREQIKSVLEVNHKGTFEVPTNSACSTDRSISTSKHSIQLERSFQQEPTQSTNRSSMPALKKAHTQFNLKDTKVHPRILKPIEKKTLDRPASPRQTKTESHSKIDASLSQKSFSMPPIHPQPLRKENTTFLHFVTNPYTFAEKPKLDRKLISYPALIRTKKYVPLEKIQTLPKRATPEEKKVEIEEVETPVDEVADVKSKKIKSKAKKNSKKRGKKKKMASGEDSEESLSDSDPVENIEPTTSQSTRPLGAQLANRRMREKIRFENARIQEFSETESDEPVEDFKELEIEMEQIEKKVQQEQVELSNFEYKTDFKPVNIDIKPRQKKVAPFVKPQLVVKTELPKKVTPRKVESPIEEEKNQKKFQLRPLQRPFRIPENEKLLGNAEQFILEDDWLLKWCILENHRNVRCEAAFAKHDSRKRGFLNGEELIQAIESIVKLNNLKMTYLFSVLNLVNVDALMFGADIKLFTIIVSLANRISHLDENWFSNLLPQYDLFTVENKVFKVKNLWSYLVDRETKLICIKDVLIEFEAGGVTSKHVEYAKDKFSHKIYFDIVDYLTYIPLFVHIHDKIIHNPLIIKQDI
ncbi:neurofilament medium polypeptide-like isoform X2 [Brachionus plicatilis]|uniref:Neurofilament medium polypeptide-like isoform X2 n=1 Tax=Brachionus plicatilis TaxID=10195 RepID=A0A3M7Q383_BRAPC|nr:neurofilament medium polypeptide-like isoform X2 [Brachionus plicatilis]